MNSYLHTGWNQRYFSLTCYFSTSSYVDRNPRAWCQYMPMTQDVVATLVPYPYLYYCLRSTVCSFDCYDYHTAKESFKESRLEPDWYFYHTPTFTKISAVIVELIKIVRILGKRVLLVCSVSCDQNCFVLHGQMIVVG